MLNIFHKYWHGMENKQRYDRWLESDVAHALLKTSFRNRFRGDSCNVRRIAAGNGRQSKFETHSTAVAANRGYLTCQTNENHSVGDRANEMSIEGAGFDRLRGSH